MQPVWRDRPVVAFMVAQTVIWASIFYSFPALVLRWQAEFGWTTTTIMGAFSLAIAMQGLAAPAFGRLIDRGSAPLSFPLGALAGAACLIAMTQVTGPVGFYGVWATMGMAMGLTLYDPCFSLVTRARGPRARHAITAITLAAGFASTLAYPLTAIVSDLAGWRAALWTLAGLVLVVNLPLARFAAVKLEQEVADQAAMTPDAPATDGPAPNQLPGFWWLAMGFALAALRTGIVMSHLFPMMAALGVTGSMAVLAGSMIGPSQVAGRVLLMLSGTRFSAMTMSVTA
ncbi:MAG: MFS transporter, partial [Roseicyclus sp.]